MELLHHSTSDALLGALILVLCLALDISVQLNPRAKFYSPIQCGTAEQCWRSGSQNQHDASMHQRLRWKVIGNLAGCENIISAIPNIQEVILLETRCVWLLRHLEIEHLDSGARLRILIRPGTTAQLLVLAPAVPVAWECGKLAIHHRRHLANIPKLFFHDVLWIVSGVHEAPWGGEEAELMINDVWEAFPADPAVEPGLPSHVPRPLATTNPRRPYRRRSRAGGEFQYTVPVLPEVDLGDIALRDSIRTGSEVLSENQALAGKGVGGTSIAAASPIHTQSQESACGSRELVKHTRSDGKRPGRIEGKRWKKGSTKIEGKGATSITTNEEEERAHPTAAPLAVPLVVSPAPLLFRANSTPHLRSRAESLGEVGETRARVDLTGTVETSALVATWCYQSARGLVREEERCGGGGCRQCVATQACRGVDSLVGGCLEHAIRADPPRPLGRVQRHLFSACREASKTKAKVLIGSGIKSINVAINRSIDQ
ncbi:hypothetical protein C8J57DRAFT_1465773 [Mycena rebaudengoi]|nr:hypothetical protein C8J57DRAFT_1465773 [Mycena rebaudengoi]